MNITEYLALVERKLTHADDFKSIIVIVLLALIGSLLIHSGDIVTAIIIILALLYIGHRWVIEKP